MRKSEVVLTLALLGSAAMSMWLLSELRAERTRNDELTARLESVPPPLDAAPEPHSTSVPAPVKPPPTSATSVETAATASPHHVQGTQEDWEAYQRRMMQQPKYREAWRAQERLAFARRRENVIRLFGFTPEQADAIVELAIDRQLRWYDRTPPNPMTEEYRLQQQALDEQDEREDQARLGKLLGEEKRARFQEYMESRATRMQVDELRPQFTGEDMLRDDQVEPLIAALHVERARMQQELSEYRDTLDQDDANSGQDFGERQIEMLKAAYDRMHAAAAPILSGPQLKRLDALLKRDLERREAQKRMQRIQSKVTN